MVLQVKLFKPEEMLLLLWYVCVQKCLKVTTEREREREGGERERQADRETDRQTDTERQNLNSKAFLFYKDRSLGAVKSVLITSSC